MARRPRHGLQDARGERGMTQALRVGGGPANTLPVATGHGPDGAGAGSAGGDKSFLSVLSAGNIRISERKTW